MNKDLQTGSYDRGVPEEILIKNIIYKLSSFWRYLISEWKALLIVGFAGGTIGFVYANFRKPVFTAQCTFVLEENKIAGALGQYSALTSMMGLDAGNSNGIFQDENITQLYSSRLMIEKTLLSQAMFGQKNELLINRYIALNQLHERWQNKPGLKDIAFNIPKEKFTVQHDSLISLFVDDINKNYLSVFKPDKKFSLISVTVKSKDQLFAKAFAENIVANVNAFYIQTKTKSALQNVMLLQRQADSLGKVLNLYMNNTAAAMDANPNQNPSMQVLRVRSQRKQVDVLTASAIYTEVNKNLEVARSVLQRSTPLIQIIDQPVLPLVNDKRGKVKSAIEGVIIAVVIASIVLLVKKIYKRIMSY